MQIDGDRVVHLSYAKAIHVNVYLYIEFFT